MELRNKHLLYSLHYDGLMMVSLLITTFPYHTACASLFIIIIIGLDENQTIPNPQCTLPDNL